MTMAEYAHWKRWNNQKIKLYPYLKLNSMVENIKNVVINPSDCYLYTSLLQQNGISVIESSLVENGKIIVLTDNNFDYYFPMWS